MWGCRVAALEAKVRLCWPLRHRSPLHAQVLRLSLDKLYATTLAWSTEDMPGWLDYLSRQGQLEIRR